MSPTVQYQDVPTKLTWTGHDGIKEMSQGAHQWSADLTFSVRTRQCNGSLYHQLALAAQIAMDEC